MRTTDGLGNLVREARLRRGWTQEQLGDKLGVEKSYVSAIETGSRKWPVEYVRSLSEVLGISQVQMAMAAGLIDAPTDMPPPTYTDFRLKEIAETWAVLRPEVQVAVHEFFRTLVKLDLARREDAESPVVAVAR